MPLKGNACLRKRFALRLGGAFRLRVTGTHHDSLVAVIAGYGGLFFLLAAVHGDFAILIGAKADNLAAIKRKNRHGNVAAVFVEDTGHAKLLGNDACAFCRKCHLSALPRV